MFAMMSNFLFQISVSAPPEAGGYVFVHSHHVGTPSQRQGDKDGVKKTRRQRQYAGTICGPGNHSAYPPNIAVRKPAGDAYSDLVTGVIHRHFPLGPPEPQHDRPVRRT
jgi:hypothetical protein